MRVSLAPSPASSSALTAPTEMSNTEPSPPRILLTTVSFGLRLFVTVQVLCSPAWSVPAQSLLLVVSHTAGSNRCTAGTRKNYDA